MAKKINKKQSLAINKLLSRENYLVTQGNDLARAFGNLNVFEHKVLDYCFSFVQQDSNLDEIFTCKTSDILNHLGLSSQGKNYYRVADAFRKLNENTALYLAEIDDDGSRSMHMTTLFSDIWIKEDGVVKFRFSSSAAPYVFQLRNNFYSFHLSELARVRSKYALTLMKLWNANSMGQLENTSIKGSVEDWQGWFLGTDETGKPITWAAGRFKDKVLNRAIDELGNLYPQALFTLTTQKMGRKVAGYQLDITTINTQLKP